MNGDGFGRELARVKLELDRVGLLPFTDAQTICLVSVVAGTHVSGSWWGHPAGHRIYQVGEAIDADPDVLVLKLWRGKLTLVDRRLWPALVKVGTARAKWQLAGLDAAAVRLLAVVARQRNVRSDRLPPGFAPKYADFRHGVRALEQRLLVITRSVHTPSGAHALEALSWAAWRARSRVPAFAGSLAAAQRVIEEAAARLAGAPDPLAALPWATSLSSRRTTGKHPAARTR